MNILTQVENSVLWLLVNNETSIKNLKKEATKLGVDENRLVFAPYISSEKHLNRIQHADLFLDTLPYNAQTTTSDALRMGLPVLTLLGKSFASRVAASLLNAVNLPELITNSQKQYESLAIELATNPKKYKIIKSKLLNNLDNAPLFNSSLFTKNLETAYEVMFEKFHQGIEPDHIYLDDESN
jgi:predicted O-linked N-acetylglucosamine transferase (SPINDLY family)